VLIARHAESLTGLVDHVAGTLASPLPDPMTTEWIGVSTRGIAGWLTQQLAVRLGASDDMRADGVLANVEFGFPGTLASQLLSETQSGQHDPWALDHTVWVLLSLLHEGAGDRHLGPVAEPLVQGTMYDRARRIADLFDRYNVRRPAMITDWAAGRFVDPNGRPLGPRQWQAELWSRLHGRIGEPSAAERLPALLRGVRTGEIGLDLPPRLTLFGLSVWPERLLQLAWALSQRRDVHLLSLAPSPALLASVMASMAVDTAVPTRSEDPTALLPMHPLVASWGRPMREAATIFALAEVPTEPAWPAETAEATIESTSLSLAETGPSALPGATLLREMQRQIHENVAPLAGFIPDGDDQSFTVHSCHGPMRQVEVLHDLLLHAFEDDPTLTEDDVVVLTADVARFAPIVDAVFGSGIDVGDRVRSPLRYRITDQALRATNPYAAAVLTLLDLLRKQRFEASKVADFISLAPVRHRFGLDDDDLSTIADWIQRTNVRWGLNGASRRRWNIDTDDPAPPNTWRSAMDQLLIGAAVTDSPYALTLGDVPTLSVEGAEVGLVGHLGDLIRSWEVASEQLDTPRSFPAWADLILDVTQELLAVPADDRWQRLEFESMLAEMVSVSAGGPTIRFADAVQVVAEKLEHSQRRASFRPGAVTITSLPALRSIPYRVVCFLGFDEQAFNADSTDGDDLTLLAPRLGDPDNRNDARQVLLEALLSATDRLILTRTGHDVVRNHEVQEAVPLAELWDTVAQTVHPDHAVAVRHQCEFRHTRHGFEEANFAAVAPTAGGRGGHLPAWPFGHDARLLAGAQQRRIRSMSRARPAVISAPGPRDSTEDGTSATIARSRVVSLASLHRLMRNPVQFHVRDGLSARIPYRENPVVDILPVTVDALDNWRTSVDLIKAREEGVDEWTWLQVAQQRGAVPPGRLADDKLLKLDEETSEFRDSVRRFGGIDGREARSLSVAVDQQVVAGVVPGVDPVLGQLGRFEYKRAKPHHRLALWLDLLALTLSEPQIDWVGALVVREAKQPIKFEGPAFMRVRGGTTAARRANAKAGMQAVLKLAAHSMHEPLPLFSLSSYQLWSDPDATAKLHNCWDDDLKDEYVSLAFAGRSWRDLNAEPPRSDDPPLAPSSNAAMAARSRVEHWSHWLWGAVEMSVAITEGLPES